MNDYTSPQFREFVRDNASANPDRLRLKYHDNDGTIDYGLAITQIACRRKYAQKLHDTLSRFDGFVFANELAGEQCTSDDIARLHADIVGASGCSVVDLTCGLGIDVMHLALSADSVTAVERQESLAEMLKYNAAGLNLDNLQVVCGDCVEMLHKGDFNADIAFIDPARRAADGSRVFALGQCEPSVTDMLPDLRKHFDRLYIKASPMLDISRTIEEIGAGVTDVYVIATHTECKELFVAVNLHPDAVAETGPVKVHALTVYGDGNYTQMTFTLAEEASAPLPALGLPAVGDYVYEPYPAITKAGAFRLFALRYGLDKPHGNTHVYFSKELKNVANADISKVAEIIPWQSKYLKRLKSRYPALDVAVRNFGMSADALRAKLGVRPASSPRLLGVTDGRGERLLLLLERL